MTPDEQKRDSREPIRPTRASEIIRIAHAIDSFARTGPGTIYVVMGTDPASHRIAAVTRDLGEARQILSSRELRDDAAPKLGDEEYAIYSVEGDVGTLDEEPGVEICWHDVFTEWWCPVNTVEAGTLTAEKVAGYELIVNLRDGSRPIHLRLPSTADMIVMREKAMDRFVWPHYDAVFGVEYTDRMCAKASPGKKRRRRRHGN